MSNYDILGVLLDLQLDLLERQERDFKRNYGSNWHPLIPVANDKLLTATFAIAKDIQETISYGVRADFSNLAETLAPYLRVHYLDHTGAKIKNRHNYFDSYMYCDISKTDSVTITINTALPENEQNFEIAFELAYSFLWHGFGVKESIYDKDTFRKRVARKLGANENEFILLNSDLYYADSDSDIKEQNKFDVPALNIACLIIIPEVQLQELLLTRPSDIISAICDKFKVSRRIANFRMKLEQKKQQIK